MKNIKHWRKKLKTLGDGKTFRVHESADIIFENGSSAENDMLIQCNRHQNSNDTLHRNRKKYLKLNGNTKHPKYTKQS
jgi:hypothetical protein